MICKVVDQLRTRHHLLCKCSACRCLINYTISSEHMKYRLAVYGALMRDQSNHAKLNDASILGAGWIPDFGLRKDGMYPAAFEFEGAKIWCEIYSVDADTLEKCDALEGVSSGHYKRVSTPTPFGEAFIYVTTAEITTGDLWFEHGLWRGRHTPCNIWQGWESERTRLIRKHVGQGSFTSNTTPSVYSPPPRHTPRNAVDDTAYEEYWATRGQSNNRRSWSPSAQDRVSMIRRAMNDFDDKLVPEEL